MNEAQTIRDRVTMPMLLDALGQKPDRNGFLLCPFHRDGDKSLKVYGGKKGWYCYGCHKGGTVIDFAMEWYGADFRSAIKEINDLMGLGLEFGKSLTDRERREMQEKRQRIWQEEARLKSALEKAQEAEEAASARYLGALTMRDEHRPKNASSCVSGLFTVALDLIPRLREEWERSEYALYKARKEVENFGSHTAH